MEEPTPDWGVWSLTREGYECPFVTSAHTFRKAERAKNKSIMDSFLGEFVRGLETQILVMKRWQGKFCIMRDLKQLIQSSDSAFIMRIKSLSGCRVGQI